MAVQLTKQGDTITVRDNELGVPNGDPDTNYTVQLLTRSVYKAILEKNTTKGRNQRTHQREDRIDEYAMSEDLLDYVVQGWVGILSDGQPAECTRENKLRLDGQRSAALMELAGLSQVEHAGAEKARSFRGPAEVR